VLASRSVPPAPFDLVLREGDELFELTVRGHYLLLSRDGIYLGRGRHSQHARFIPYEDLTHLSTGDRALWLGTRSTVHLIARGRRTPVSFAEVARGIERRLGRRPGGAIQLARMREIDQRARSAGTYLVTMGVVALCVAIHLLQVSDAFVSEVGAFVRELVGEGELWRVVTAHFLHDDSWTAVTPETAAAVPLIFRVPLHITLNCAGALLLGNLVERPLGHLRTIFVLAAAALGSVGLSAAVSAPPMIGASGMVLGLAGALLALELSVPERLPASWRIPRRLFITAIILQGMTDYLLPFVAGWAHIGGFAGGYLAARIVAPGAFRPRPSPVWLRRAALATGLAVVVAFAAATPLVLRAGWAFNRHAENVLALDAVGAMTLNNLAWRIATETTALPDAPLPAIDLASRAVDETERANPDYLDTLAEVQFLAGDASSALDTIDEAIEIAPWDDYFREQRDRFIGLRARDDRPDSPSLPWFLRGPSEPAEWDDGTGVGI